MSEHGLRITPSRAAFRAALKNLDWPGIASQLDAEGYAVLAGLLEPTQAQSLAHRLNSCACAALRRVSLASCGLGRGELHFFGNQLPEPLAAWRVAFYEYLAPIANRWNETLGLDYRYPATLHEFQQRNRQAGQTRPLSRYDRLGESDFVALHQQSRGEHVFPMQIVALLGVPGADYTGGEFLMTEQRPRMQSRPMVVPLRLGDAAIIATAQRPFKGSKGHYRVNLKHAIGRVRSGQRIGLELSFHDGP